MFVVFGVFRGGGGGGEGDFFLAVEGAGGRFAWGGDFVVYV